MIRARRFALAIALSCLAAASAAPAAAAADPAPDPAAATPPVFKAGFAERDITPERGAEQPGGYGKAFNTGKHDPCKVRAGVFDDGRARVAIVGIDGLGVRADTVAAARRLVKDRCGIEPGSVLIAASHSHSAGPMLGAIPGEWDGASDLVRSLVYEKSTVSDPAYLARVETAIADAVTEADAKRVEARAAAGFGRAEGVAFNRRFRMKNGLTFSHPGQGNPDIVEPAGPVDPQVGVLGAWDAGGKLLGCVVNFACHATTGPGGTSADYVYYVERTIRGLMGEDVVVVFLPGASGDVTQVDNRSPHAVPQFGERAARLVGGTVGAEALKVLLAGQAGAGPLAPVGAASQTLKMARRVPDPERVTKATELLRRAPGGEGVDPTEWTFAKETVVLDAILKRQPEGATVEVQAVQVGPVAFLACPAEYFCQFGLDLKKGAKFPITFPVSLANGAVGYVPTEEALGPGGGGYETRLTSYSNLRPDAGRIMAEALLALAGRMTPGPVPQPPPLTPDKQGRPWAYGNKPPELK